MNEEVVKTYPIIECIQNNILNQDFAEFSNSVDRFIESSLYEEETNHDYDGTLLQSGIAWAIWANDLKKELDAAYHLAQIPIPQRSYLIFKCHRIMTIGLQWETVADANKRTGCGIGMFGNDAAVRQWTYVQMCNYLQAPPIPHRDERLFNPFFVMESPLYS